MPVQYSDRLRAQGDSAHFHLPRTDMATLTICRRASVIEIGAWMKTFATLFPLRRGGKDKGISKSANEGTIHIMLTHRGMNANVSAGIEIRTSGVMDPHTSRS